MPTTDCSRNDVSSSTLTIVTLENTPTSARCDIDRHRMPHLPLSLSVFPNPPSKPPNPSHRTTFKNKPIKKYLRYPHPPIASIWPVTAARALIGRCDRAQILARNSIEPAALTPASPGLASRRSALPHLPSTGVSQISMMRSRVRRDRDFLAHGARLSTFIRRVALGPMGAWRLWRRQLCAGHVGGLPEAEGIFLRLSRSMQGGALAT